MKEANSIEQRLEALEATVAALQKRLNPLASSNWAEGFIPPGDR